MKNFYLEEFNDLLGDIKNEDEFKEVLPKLIFYGIKYINNSSDTIESLESSKERLDFIKLILALVEQITPNELQSIFPIEDRFSISETKFSLEISHEFMDANGADNPIKKPADFLWFFNNKDTANFSLKVSRNIANLEILSGKNTDYSWEGMTNSINYSSVGVAKFHLSPDDNPYLINPEGKKVSLKRQYPGYLKTVKRSDSNVE